MTAKRRHPTSAGVVLDGVTRKIGVKERLDQYRVWTVWNEVVGPQTAAHAQPHRLRDDTLEVRVDHPVWMQQLQLLKPRILQRLNAALAPATIKEIHWKQGSPPSSSATAPWQRPEAPPPPRPLNREEQEQLDRLIPEDESEIHQAWRRLLALHLQRTGHNS